MPNVKLDTSFVQTATCPEGKKRVDFYDVSVTGLILTVYPSGKRTFTVRYDNKYGELKQYKIGSYPEVSLDRAKRKALQIKGQAALGEDPAEDRRIVRAIPTVSEVADRFIEYVRSYKSSHFNDERALRNHILPRFGKLRLDQVTQEDVAIFLKGMINLGYKPATANFVHVVFGHLFRCAKQWGIPGSDVNPVDGIKHFVLNNARDRYLSAEEAKRLQLAVECSENTQLQYFIPLLLLTGVRKSELIHARWEDFDLDNRRWRVPKSKSGSARHVPLSREAVEILNKVPRWDDCPYVLPNPRTKKPFRSFFLAWDNARKKAGLPEVRLHDLRHSAASAMVQAGQSLYIVGKVLGHVRPTTTQRYAHLDDQALLAAVDAGARVIAGDRNHAVV